MGKAARTRVAIVHGGGVSMGAGETMVLVSRYFPAGKHEEHRCLFVCSEERPLHPPSTIIISSCSMSSATGVQDERGRKQHSGFPSMARDFALHVGSAECQTSVPSNLFGYVMLGHKLHKC